LSPAALRADPEAIKARRRYVLSRIAIYGLLAAFALIYLLPALAVLIGSFRTNVDLARNGIFSIPQSFTANSWVRAWTQACVSGRCNGIAPNFWNSLVITIPSTLVSTSIGVINGYILSKWKFRGSEWVFAGLVVGIFLPGQVTLLPWAFIIGNLGLSNNVVGLILIHSVMGIAFTTLFCRNFYSSVPDEIIKAARVDGAGFWRTFFRVILPLSSPIIIVAVIWQFTSIWNEYLYGVVFTSGSQQPITAALQSVGRGGGATPIIAAIPPLLIFALGGRYFVRGLTQGALK
jgi:glucose/mannose transport system permease protein